MLLEFLRRLGDEVGVSAHTQHFDGLDAASADQIAAHGSLPHDPTVDTLIETAKLNDVDPQAWLADMLARMPDHPARRIAELLLWNWQRAQNAAQPPDLLVRTSDTIWAA